MSKIVKKPNNVKTTVYLHPVIKKNVKYYAVRDEKSLSEIVNRMLIEYIEEQEDIADAEKARLEESVSFEEVLSDLGITLDEIQDRAKTERQKTTKEN